MPLGIEEPAFGEPWQAEAFALVVTLAERGAFSWSEWAAALSAELHRPDAAADGRDYYDHWLKALETLITAKRLTSAAEIESVAAAWQRAAHATPHGKPILLENDPLGRRSLR